MTTLPKWVLPYAKEPLDEEEARLVKALSIAWEALAPFRKNAEWVLEKPNERACGIGCDMVRPTTLITHSSSCPIWLAAEAMRQIEELGK